MQRTMQGSQSTTDATCDLQIPVLNISLSGGDEKTAAALVDACANYGFVFVNGQGLGFSSKVLNSIFELSQRFFGYPVEEKQKCAIQSNNIGWSSIHSETLDPKHQQRGDFKEAMNFGEFKNGKPQQSLPPSLLHNEQEIANFEELCHNLCIKLLKLFALGLKIDPHDGEGNWFASRHDPLKGSSGSVLRWLHYPVVENTQSSFDNIKDIRAGAHSDYGSLTLLFQRSGQFGLEILTPSSKWAPVPVNPPGTETDPYPPILVNIGDLMQFWTNGLLKSTVHRVVFPDGEANDRYSIAYFCHPLDHIRIETIPSDVVKQQRKVGGEQTIDQPITAEGYLRKRLQETYGWGKEQS